MFNCCNFFNNFNFFNSGYFMMPTFPAFNNFFAYNIFSPPFTQTCPSSSFMYNSLNTYGLNQTYSCTPSIFGFSNPEMYYFNNTFSMQPTADIYNSPVTNIGHTYFNTTSINTLQSSPKSATINKNKKVKNNDNNSTNQVKSATDLKQRWGKINPDLSQKFYEKIIDISQKINCSPDDLLALMNAESGLDSKIQNSIGATGLIQFLPSTAKNLGTTTDKLKEMSPEEQLNYVEKYLVKAKKSAKMGKSRLNAGQLYALVFLPARANRDILSSKGDKYYAQNKGLDKNKDGSITIDELNSRITTFMA